MESNVSKYHKKTMGLMDGMGFYGNPIISYRKGDKISKSICIIFYENPVVF